MKKKIVSVLLLLSLLTSWCPTQLVNAAETVDSLVEGLPKNGTITKERVRVHVVSAEVIDYYINGKLKFNYRRVGQNITFAENGHVKLVIHGEEKDYTRTFTIDRMAPKIWRSGNYIKWSDSISGIKKVTINGQKVKGKKYKMKKYRLRPSRFRVIATDKAGNEYRRQFVLS